MKIIEGRIKISHIGSVPVQYIIKEEAGKIIAVTTARRLKYALVDNLDDQLDWLTPYNMQRSIVKKLHMPHTYRAIASLDPSDIWDEKEGLRVATAKLKDKMEKSVEKRINILKSYLHNAADAL